MEANAVIPETKIQSFREKAEELHEMAEGSSRDAGKLDELIKVWDLITSLKDLKVETDQQKRDPGVRSPLDAFGLIASYLSTEKLDVLTTNFPDIKAAAQFSLSRAETEVSFSEADLTAEQCHDLFREPLREIRDDQEYIDEGGLFANFSKVKFSEIKMDPMCFSELPRTLKELTIENIKLSVPDDQQSNPREIWVEILQSIIDRAPTLEVLRMEFSLFDQNDLGRESVELIAHRMGSLKELSLISSAIGPEGAWELANGNLQGLRKLKLTHNMIGSRGASEIAKGNFSELSYLDLSCNAIKSDGVRAIASGNLESLRELILTGNNLGQSSASAIAEGNFLELRHLNLNCNSIGRAGAFALAQGNLKKLTHLFLKENKIKGDTKHLCRQLRQNLQHLEVLSCGDRGKHKPGV